MGHQIVAGIAEKYMTNQAHDFVQNILNGYHPDGKRFHNLIELAPFADTLRTSHSWASNFHFVSLKSDKVLSIEILTTSIHHIRTA
jgi:hypothetical protein